jgi:hypothetical protein
LTSLARSKRVFEAEVLSRKSELLSEQMQTRKTAVDERHALVAAVSSRAAAVQALHARIHTLRRKDAVLHQ